MKNKISTSLLALFFGWLGAHHFYLNNEKKGYKFMVLSVLIIALIIFQYFIPINVIKVIMLILTVILLILVAFDFIYFLTISDEIFDEKHNVYSLNTYSREIQKEVDSYYLYVKKTDLEQIKYGSFPQGSYNALLQELLIIYEKMINVKPSQIILYKNNFSTLQNQINKINTSIGDPEINYFNFFYTYFPDDSF
ncbi:TM2 domain-containing protein [Chryseobacterium formosus]|uniref:TM2 domain-containing protein n=1 Tax=Chryseobacterium formosus TaxID=1537363 RepID=A0ABT3XS75_9FLAO|nr:TM2 domain-containing protein [Chryseobacterium formosus]MCX8523961.1 TM2 domain-containing protein [Chryseobacterium formosus]